MPNTDADGYRHDPELVDTLTRVLLAGTREEPGLTLMDQEWVVLNVDPRDIIQNILDRLVVLRPETPLTKPASGLVGGQRQGGAATSTEARDLIAPKADTQRRRVLDVHVAHSVGGLTDVEVGDLLGLPGNSVRPRRVELVDGGWVVATDVVRVHHGRKHVVWRVTPAALDRVKGLTKR